MRKKKAIINSGISFFTFFIIFIPNLFIQQIFLHVLGEDLRGLNGLYGNIIGWLSIVELGVGTAIVFSLYKPFANNDYSKVRAYLKFYRNFYLRAGLFILISGLIITPFLSFFIENKDINMYLVQTGFILYLLNSFISYLFSSRLCVLTVAQEGYKLSLATTISKLITFIIQFIILKIYPSFILFIAAQLIVNFVYYIIINIYTVNRYSWLNDGDESLEVSERSRLIKSVKAMFMHKIGSLFVFSTDNLVISKFIGLSQLGYYLNYHLIINAAQNLIGSAQHGITASVGNLLIEKDPKYACEVHKKIFFLNFWISSFVSISLYNTLNQFICLWIGEKYLIDSLTYSIIIINCYFYLMRQSIERFKEASGNYVQDRYAPLAESIINLICSLILVQHLGLAGVFIGTLISNLTVLFWVQPYIVYKYVFEAKLIDYILMYIKYTLIGLTVLLITIPITNLFKFEYNAISFIINCLLNIIIINGIYLILFFKKSEFQYFFKIVKKNNNL